MSDPDWHTLLNSWSRHNLAAGDDRDNLSAEGFDEQALWIGYPGAGEEQIAQAEHRLKTRLPESYRKFLKITNGWSTGGPYVTNILPVEEIEWVSTRKRAWLEYWKLGMRLGSENGDLSAIEEGLGFDIRTLESSLEISDEDMGVYLLMPGLKSVDGEWEAWCFEGETGAVRYPSFWELMRAEFDLLQP